MATEYLHYPNGDKIPTLKTLQNSQFPDIVYSQWGLSKDTSKVNAIINMKVGESITIHFPLAGLKKGEKVPDRYRIFFTSLDLFDIKSSAENAKKNFEDLTYNDFPHHKNFINAWGEELACFDITITAKKEGAAEMAYHPLSMAHQLIRIVVGSGAPQAQKPTTQTSTQKPADNTPSQKTTTPTTPADENTVKVAGTDRTPGQVQSYSSGGYLYTVNHGDTLYDLTKRFYGNGDLWKELQKANQKYLNETKDGIIFVGFNLFIPAELGGVRANAR